MKKYFLLFFLLSCTINSQYKPEGQQFRYEVYINKIRVTRYSSFNWEGRLLHIEGNFYHFEIEDFPLKYPSEYEYILKTFNSTYKNNDPKLSKNKENNLSLKEEEDFLNKLYRGEFTFSIFSNGINIPLEEDEIYKINGMYHGGWPTTYGLFISNEDEYLFGGLADADLNKTIKIPPDFPFKISLEKLLAENKLNTDTFDYFNLLYNYALKNKKIQLSQDEGKEIDDFYVYQGISRKQVLATKNRVYDGGVNGISFIIIKK